MEERSLKVLSSNTTFISKISNTLTKLLIPTKVGLNGMLITLKRNSVLKAYENYKNADEDEQTENYLNRYEESYTLYLESIDKYIMDSVYKKVKSGNATSFERNALSNYYNVVHLKERDYQCYKSRKQKFLLDLDYNTVLNSGKEKNIKRYKKLYVEKSDELYKSILKNYSVKISDKIDLNDQQQLEVYQNIFFTLDEYIKEIFPLKLEDNFEEFEKIKSDYDYLDNFDIGKLDEKDYLEKNMILLGISRKIFTHSLPLIAAEYCYKRLISDARNLIISTNNTDKQEENYKVLLKIIENYNEKILSSKIYWENSDEKDNYKKFLKTYSNSKNSDEKEIAILRKELCDVKEDGPKSKKIRKFYKEKLVNFGVMRNLKNTCRTLIEFEVYTKKSV